MNTVDGATEIFNRQVRGGQLTFGGTVVTLSKVELLREEAQRLLGLFDPMVKIGTYRSISGIDEHY